MLHQDTRTKSSHLRHVTQWLLQRMIWDRSLHAKCTWTFRWLVSTALLWAWSSEQTLKERFDCAQRITIRLQSNEKIRTSMQAFVEILSRHTTYLRGKLLQACRERMRRDFPQWKTFGFVVFGRDGSDFAVPRTQSNQDAFTTDGKSPHQKRRKKKSKQASKQRNNPGILMTTLFHTALALPWDWRPGSKSDNERAQLIEMLPSLPKNSLIVGDAGFVGDDFLAAIRNREVDVIVRVGSNVTLLKQLGDVRHSADTVCVWPDAAARKNQPPLVFRLVVMQGPRHPISLITSVLSKTRLSDSQVTQLYRDHRDIEVYHRHVKQTPGRRKLLSRKAENALVELQWTILGFLAMTLYAAAELHKQGLPPDTMSAAGVFRAFRHTIRDYLHPVVASETLNTKIHASVKDDDTRASTKNSHNYPRKRKHKPAGKPIICEATKAQKKLAKQIKRSLTALTGTPARRFAGVSGKQTGRSARPSAPVKAIE